MQNKLFIGNLSFKLGEDDIRELFEKFGTITEVAIPRNRENDKPRGFAFITFETEDSAKKALALDGHEVDGRKIRVSIATGEKRTGGAGAGGRGGERRASSYND
jgi:RNA recognition motif-containing protein